MIIRRERLSKRIMKRCLLYLYNRIENNGNCVFQSNGEAAFIRHLFSHFAKLNRRVTMFDVGGNIGDYAEMLLANAKAYGVDDDLHIFEPVAKCVSAMQQRFASAANVSINPVGLSNKGEKSTIYYDCEGSSLASLTRRNLKHYKMEMALSEDIETIRGLDYVHDRQISHIDFLKIDVEGHELQVLEGLGPFVNGDCIDFIQFEYGGANLDSRTSLMEMFDYLLGRGFRVAKVMPRFLEERGYEPDMENYGYSNYVAISNRVVLE